MEDRIAVSNTHQRGVTLEERDKFMPVDKGVPQNWGVPKMDGEQIAEMTQLLGVPMAGPGAAPDPEDMPATKCVATTKKGNPCKAYAVNASAHCYGHNR